MATFSVEPSRADEYPGNVYFTVSLSQALSYDVTFEYTTFSMTAIGGTDYSQASRELTIKAGDNNATFYVNGAGDATVEPDEAFGLELFNPMGAGFGKGITVLRTVGWILDDDVSGGDQSVAVVGPVIAESAGKATFTISLSEAFSSTKTLDFRTVAGSATAGSDFVARTGAVTFAAGETKATVQVTLKDDKVVEPSETFGLAVSGAGLSAYGEATIANDDGRVPVLSLEAQRHTEYPGNVYFIARLSEAAPSDVRVYYHTFSGSALGGEDFSIADNRSLLFREGETEKVFYINGAGDTDPEPDESIGVELYNAEGAIFGGRNQTVRAEGWLLDDDPSGGDRALAVTAPVVEEGGGKAVFTLSLSEAFTEDTTLRFKTVAGSARAGSDFTAKSGSVTFAAGQTEASVAIALKNDRVAEATETFHLAVSGKGVAADGRAVILDGDASRPVLSIEAEHASEYPGNVYFTVRLSEASDSTITVDYQTINGTALAGSDFAVADRRLQFDPRETVKTFYVNGAGDSTSESDEFFSVGLSGPVGASLGPGLRDLTTTGWILDDEPGTEKRAMHVSDLTVSESAGYAHFTISISQPLDDDLTIRFRTQNGSARADRDYRAESGRVTLAEGATEAVVSVKLLNDRKHEGTESFNLKITDFDHDSDFASAGLDLVGLARIIDDDRARSVVHFDDALL